MQQRQQKEHSETCCGGGVDSKLITEFKESHKMQCCKIKNNVQNSKNGSQVVNWILNRIDNGRFGKERKNSTGSAKHQNAPSEHWEILNCLTWDRFCKPFNAKRAYNTHLMGYFVVQVVHALCLRRNRRERFELNLRFCLSRSLRPNMARAIKI